jgi:hypothetical protein
LSCNNAWAATTDLNRREFDSAYRPEGTRSLFFSASLLNYWPRLHTIKGAVEEKLISQVVSYGHLQTKLVTGSAENAETSLNKNSPINSSACIQMN